MPQDLLFLSQRIPYPPTKGDKIRSWHILRHLSQRFRVHLGCFYDDPVHDVLGLTGHAFQSLYHFTIGLPVEDIRLTTEPGYAWELEQLKNLNSEL